jgi:hypothetical protein
MIKRLGDLLVLLAAAWSAWREGGPDNEEIEAYADAWESRSENVIYLLPRDMPDTNAVHFRDTRRLH